MMTREELYGRSSTLNYTLTGQTLAIPDGSDIRVWTLTSDDFAGVGNVIQLPDPTTIRPAGGATPSGTGAQGGPLYYIMNFTTFAASIDLEDANGNPLGFFNIGEMFVVSLLNPFVLAGEWCVMKKTVTTGSVGLSTRTISFGSDTSLFNQARSYGYETDTWVSQNDIPIASGNTSATTAADHIGTTGLENTYTALTYDLRLYRYEPAAGGTYTQLAQPSFECTYSGLADSSGGLASTSFLDDFFHIANAGVGGTPRFTETYSITGNAWSAGPTTPSAINAFLETVVVDEGFDQIQNILYINPTSPDSAAGWYALGLTTLTYAILKNPPWPYGHTAPSVIGIGNVAHYQNGNFDVSGFPNPGFSTNAHYQFAKGTNSWSALPQSPVVARGMGIRGTRLYRDRYTFGMGADKDHPSTLFISHTEYNLNTRSYRARGTASWADSDRREGAWARTDPGP